MVLVAYAGPVRPAAALRDSVLCLPTDIHSLFVNKPSSSSSSSSSKKNFNGHGEARCFGAHTMRQGGRLGEWATGFGPWHLG